MRRELATECRFARNSQPSAALSALTAPGPSSSELAERVQRLECLLQNQLDAQQEPSALTLSSLSPIPPLSTAKQSDKSLQANVNVSSGLAGTLHTSEAGHVRFVPSFLDLQTNITLSGHTSPSAQGNANPYPIDNVRRSTHEFLIALPPSSHCTELVRVYFASFASLFHILHDPTFYQQYDSFMQDPESMPLAWIALLYAVLGTAVLALPSDSYILQDLSRNSRPLAKIADLSERYRSLSMRCLEADHYLWDHNVTTLQTLIVMIYGISHSYGQAWTLIGLAHNLARSIGCHVDPSGFDLDVVECEERRRCWAGLKMLYTVQNTAMGHIGDAYAFEPSNCALPAEVNDDDLISGEMEVIQQQDSNKATQMSYLLIKFRLYGKFCM